MRKNLKLSSAVGLTALFAAACTGTVAGTNEPATTATSTQTTTTIATDDSSCDWLVTVHPDEARGLCAWATSPNRLETIFHLPCQNGGQDWYTYLPGESSSSAIWFAGPGEAVWHRVGDLQQAVDQACFGPTTTSTVSPKPVVPAETTTSPPPSPIALPVRTTSPCEDVLSQIEESDTSELEAYSWEYSKVVDQGHRVIVTEYTGWYDPATNIGVRRATASDFAEWRWAFELNESVAIVEEAIVGCDRFVRGLVPELGFDDSADPDVWYEHPDEGWFSHDPLVGSQSFADDLSVFENVEELEQVGQQFSAVARNGVSEPSTTTGSLLDKISWYGERWYTVEADDSGRIRKATVELPTETQLNTWTVEVVEYGIQPNFPDLSAVQPLPARA